MSARPAPPRLSAWLVAISVPGSDRASLLGDLEERFGRRVGTRGARRARLWYRRQALRILFVLGPRRIGQWCRRMAAPGTGRAALRSLGRSPATSLAATATLAVGIAAPVSMFALADGITSSLPGDPQDRVVRVSWVDRAGSVEMGFPWQVLEAWRERATGPGHALVGLAAFRSDGPVAAGGGETPAVRDRGVYATSALFGLLGVAPVLGRLYADERDAGLPAVLIREDVWAERFDRDPDVLGRVLRIDGVDHVVVGVLPRGFGFPVDHRLWMQPSGDRNRVWSVVGRLAPGASASVAREQLATVLAAAPPEPPAEKAPTAPALRVQRYPEAHFSNGREPEITRRIGMVSLILVALTAVNVAAVMVARGMSRARETAIRRAIGASRLQVMALTLTEGLLVVACGAVLGLGLGQAAMKVMVRYVTSQAAIIPYWLDFSPGARSVVLTVLLALLALAIAGLLPALSSSRTDLDRALRARPHGAPGGTARVMTWVVGLEVTLSCSLLAVAGVVIEEGLATLRTGADFATAGVLTGQFILEPPDYSDMQARRRFFPALLDALRNEPFVSAAALTSALPGKEGVVLPAGPAERAQEPGGLSPAQVRSIGAGFFPLFGVSVSAGRLFSEADVAADPPVAIVNEAFARRHGMTRDAPGRRIVLAGLGGGRPYTATVVGLVDDRGVTPHAAGQPPEGVYLPMEQMPSGVGYLLVRTRDQTPLPEVWQAAVRTLDPYLPLGDVLTLQETLRRGHGAATLYMSVFLGLGSLALLMALVGLHGIHSFSLARRVREIGLRRALGAREGQVVRESVLRGLRPVWMGVLLGTAPGVLAARMVVPVQPGVSTWLAAPFLLIAVSLLALWRPTRAAARAHPMDALRRD